MQNDSNRGSRAGGAILAFSILAGALIGVKFGQPSMGVVGGIAFGVAISLGLFIIDRQRGR